MSPVNSGKRRGSSGCSSEATHAVREERGRAPFRRYAGNRSETATVTEGRSIALALWPPVAVKLVR
jgi:hypothetical protein